MDKEDLKTAKEIELVESVVEQTNDTLENKSAGDGQSASIPTADDTDSHVQFSDETLSVIETATEIKQVAKPDLPSEDRLIGKIVGGHYEILAPIGQGGMSRVYKAKHLLLNRNVAIKLLALGRQFDRMSIARFQKEAEAAVELQHQNICSTKEFGVNEEGIPFLVMDYLEGTSLGDTLTLEKTLPKKLAIEIMSGICAGLEHAHSQGVIHRDIKPANIILTKDKAGSDVVKIVDFGIAKLIREDESGPNLTQTGEVFGTPKYMSPEQCLGHKVDQRADIYALGCIFYEMLAGHPPFSHESSIQVLFAHVNEEPPTISQRFGKEIQAILDRCLQKDVSRRYQNVSQLQADLQAIKLGGSLVHARPAGIQPKTLIATATLAAFMCLILYFFFNANASRDSASQSLKNWTSVHEEALSYKPHNLPAAERLLEKGLEIARQSHNESIITLTLQELSEVELAQGKTKEADKHKKNIVGRIKGGNISSYFLQIALLMVGLGFVLMIFAVTVFGTKFQTKTLQEIFSKKE